MNGIEKLLIALHQAGLISQEGEEKLGGEEVADLLWLLQYVHQKQGTQTIEPVPDKMPSVEPEPPPIPFSQEGDEKAPPERERKQPGAGLERETARHIYLPSQRLSEQGGQGGLLFRSPAASALPQSLDIARALRPLMRRIPSRTNFLLDEPATAQRIAETEKTSWAPVLRPAPTRWLEIALVADIGASMTPWRQTIDELRILLEHHGAFRDVRTWRLATDEPDSAALYAGTDMNTQQERDPGELIDPSGRRLILVVSDAVSPAWHSGKVQELLNLWGQNNLVTLVQVFPKRLWTRTTLSNADIVDIHIANLNRGNAGLIVRGEQMEFDEEIEIKAFSPIPIVTLEPSVLANWAKMIAGAENAWTLGAVFYQNLPTLPEEAPFVQNRPSSPRDLVRQFRATASSTASRLISLLSAAPISFPVIRLVQQALLPQANQVHIAEIFLSGLLKEIARNETTNDPDAVEYDFLPGVREILHESIPLPSEFEVIEAISAFLGSRYGTLRDFYALANSPSTVSSNTLRIGAESRPFAHIVASAWRHVGGMYDTMADNLEQYVELGTEQEGLMEAGDGVKMVEEVNAGKEEVEAKSVPVEEAEDTAREKTSFDLVAEQLEQTGWVVQDFNKMNLTQDQGIAVDPDPSSVNTTTIGIRFRLTQGIAVSHDPAFPEDYILYLDQEVVGVVKVRPIGEPLAGVEEPVSLRELKLNKPKRRDTTMFVYESNGKETRFSIYIEPEPRSRSVFTFHRPETLALWISQAPPDMPVEQNNLLRSRLRRMPPISESERPEALIEIEKSLAVSRMRTLVQIPKGAGKTVTLVREAYRLLEFANARRVLYLVNNDRLAPVAYRRFEQFGTSTRQTSLYKVQLLQSGFIDSATNICIATIEQLYQVFWGWSFIIVDEAHKAALSPISLENKTFEMLDKQEISLDRLRNSPSVQAQESIRYNSLIPIEFFDAILIDDCSSNIYKEHRPVLEYFDAFIIGATSKADRQTLSFFGRNLVYDGQTKDVLSTITRRLWNYADVLRDDLLSSDYMEQLTYLLFLKMAYETTEPPYSEISRMPAGYDWQSLVTSDLTGLHAHYTQILRILSSEKGMLGVIFKNAVNKIRNPINLHHLIVGLIDKETWIALDADMRGAVYEGLLQINFGGSRIGSGQYFTPRPLIHAIVDVMQPKLGQTICDPAVGTGGFLLVANDYMTSEERNSNTSLSIKEKKELTSNTLYGSEIIDDIARLCVMNLFLHGIVPDDGSCPIVVEDSLLSPPQKHYDMVLSNPPLEWRSGVNSDSIQRQDFIVITNNKQLNFIQHIESLLKPYGRAAIVISDNVLFEGGASEKIRDDLLKTCDVHTLLRLPAGILYPESIKANVVFFDRMPASDTPWTKELWVYDFRTNQNFTPRTNPLKRMDLEDFVQSYKAENRHQRKETERFRKFTYDELVKRERINLDIFWLNDVEIANKVVSDFGDFVEKYENLVITLEEALRQSEGSQAFEILNQLISIMEKFNNELSVDSVWRAYSRLEPSWVRAAKNRRVKSDLINLIRYTMQRNDNSNVILAPFKDTVNRRFTDWLDNEQRTNMQSFTTEQIKWLERIRDHIAANLEFKEDDFDRTPFSFDGGRIAAKFLFGDELSSILQELNEVLVRG